jgi:hypothetical protein
MRLRVDVTGDKGVIRGKIWKKADAEPTPWTITLDDPLPVRQGSPGLYGDSVTDLYWDNLNVKVTE